METEQKTKLLDELRTENARAHLFPYFWLYKTKTYLVFSIVLPILALVLRMYCGTKILAIVFACAEIVFSAILYKETKKFTD